MESDFQWVLFSTKYEQTLWQKKMLMHDWIIYAGKQVIFSNLQVISNKYNSSK